MSTKIYNAYRFKGSAELLMKEYVPKFNAEFKDWYRKMWIKQGDKLDDVKNRFEYFFGPEGRFTSEMVVYFHKRRIYVQFFSNVHFTLDERFEDYHFQNQTDPPDDIPYRKYNARGKIWDAILEPSCIPAKVGLSYTFSTWNNVFDTWIDPILEESNSEYDAKKQYFS